MDMHQQVEEIVQTITDIELVEPSDYAVVLLNDDRTPMEFVVHVLENVFHLDHDKSVDVMLKIHQEGEGAAGIYTFEIAEQKGLETTVLARTEGFPLKVRLDPQ
jgi:ATP-dependent Clp protease adaptor protein ClpS